MLTSFIKYFFLVNNVCATCTDGAKNDKACKTTSTSEELALFQHVAAKVSPPRTRGQSKLNEEANPTVLVKRSALAEPAETAELAEPGELAEPAEPAEPAELAEPAVADAPSDAVQDIENVLQDIAKNEQKAADHEETEAADLQLNEQHDTKVFQPVSSSAVKDLGEKGSHILMMHREPSAKHVDESPVPMPTPSTDMSLHDLPIALPKLSGQLSHMAEKSESSISSSTVQSLLFWEIDGNDDGFVNVTECQAFVHKPRCQHCLKGLFQEQDISNKTLLEVRLCQDLGLVNESSITRTDFMQALKQTAAALIVEGSSEHHVDTIKSDDLSDLDERSGWDCW